MLLRGPGWIIAVRGDYLPEQALIQRLLMERGDYMVQAFHPRRLRPGELVELQVWRRARGGTSRAPPGLAPPRPEPPPIPRGAASSGDSPGSGAADMQDEDGTGDITMGETRSKRGRESSPPGGDVALAAKGLQEMDLNSHKGGPAPPEEWAVGTRAAFRTSMWESVAHETLQEHAEVLEALRKAGTKLADAVSASLRPPIAPPGYEWAVASWANFRESMSKLGYDPSAAMPDGYWRVLGLDPTAGQRPTAAQVDQRVRQALLLGKLFLGHWIAPGPEKAAAEGWVAKVTQAGKACHEDLPGIPVVERVVEDTPTFREPSKAWHDWLLSDVDDNTRPCFSALWLSDRGEQRPTGEARCLSIDNARQLDHMARKGPAKLAEALAPYRNGRVLMWLPDRNGDRLAGALTREVVHQLQVEVIAVALRDPCPPCSRADLFEDYWRSPLAKQTMAVARVRHIRQPIMVTLEQDGAPVVRERGLSLFTLNPASPKIAPTLIDWAPAWSAGTQGTYMIADVAASQCFAAQVLFDSIRGCGSAGWEGPLRSPATGGGERWSRYRVYWKFNAATEAEIQGRARWVMAKLPGQCLAAASTLYESESCKVIEGKICANADMIQQLAGEIVVINGNLALMHASASQQRWGEVLTELLKNRPHEAIRQIRWRKGPRGGDTWARPGAAQDQAHARIALAGGKRRQALPPEGEAQVYLQGALGADPEGALATIAAKVGALVGYDLKRLDPGLTLAEGQWSPVLDARDMYQPRIGLRLGSLAQVRTLKAKLDGRYFELHMEQKHMHLESLHLAAAELDRVWGPPAASATAGPPAAGKGGRRPRQTR